jgi:hypothetical protein
MKIYETMNIFEYFLTYMGIMVGAGSGAEIFDKLEPKPLKN